MRIKLLFVLGAVAIAVGALVLVSLEAMAQTEGEVVPFMVPANTNMFGMIVVAGPSKETTSVGGTCVAPGNFPVQQLVVINEQPGTGVVRVDAIILRDEPLEPGTKLVDLISLGNCDDTDGTRYDKFFGTVTSGKESTQD